MLAVASQTRISSSKGGAHRRTSMHMLDELRFNWPRSQPRAHPPARLLLRPLVAAGAWSKIKCARFPLNDGIGALAPVPLLLSASVHSDVQRMRLGAAVAPVAFSLLTRF